MNNKSIGKIFKLYSQLMELHSENPFRTRAMSSAAFKIDKLPFEITSSSLNELSKQPGIGESTAQKIISIVNTGSFEDLDNLLKETPEGVIEMMDIKGLGPKKLKVIWQDLGIESLGELLYACNENRLKDAKGFGLKSQEDIRKAIEFKIANRGWLLFAKAQPLADQIYHYLKNNLPTHINIEFTGDYRRKSETLNKISILTDSPLDSCYNILVELSGVDNIVKSGDQSIGFQYEGLIEFEVLHSSSDQFAKNLLLTTGSDNHIANLAQEIPAGSNEEDIYHKMNMMFIEPELREGTREIELAKENKLPQLITYSDIKGTLHNHSTYSDGIHTLKEMALYCKDEMKLEYFGICDHSRTAVYAGGLTESDLIKQWEEIDLLNKKLAPFKIFKGIESDILSDGSLDYPEEILAQFDFVVASVHSNLKMDEEKATNRLIKAIENPYTTILGHPTGRLLLSRPGYPLDFKKIIDACAANKVVIEINSNPLRLDLDWRWYSYALDKGIIFSINPDAHRKEGLYDMKYGIHVARKGGLESKDCLNCMGLKDIKSYFESRKRC